MNAVYAPPGMDFFGQLASDTLGWPLYVGLAAALVLVFGAVENAWRSRPLRSRPRAREHGRFRLVPGGKSKGKGNGHAQDLTGPPEDDGDKPRWVM